MIDIKNKGFDLIFNQLIKFKKIIKYFDKFKVIILNIE